MSKLGPARSRGRPGSAPGLRRNRRQRGLSLIEVSIGAAIGAIVLGASVSAMDSTRKVADASSRSATVVRRADRAITPMVSAFRRCSLSSVRDLTDTALVEGTPASAVRLQEVVGWDSAPVLGPPTEYEWIVPAGATEGTVVIRENGRERVLARGITAFEVERVRNTFEIRLRTETGPDNDLHRELDAAIAVAPRNP
jgi:prepilin-type N-terminal cleavage/methylation domain-containing protein